MGNRSVICSLPVQHVQVGSGHGESRSYQWGEVCTRVWRCTKKVGCSFLIVNERDSVSMRHAYASDSPEDGTSKEQSLRSDSQPTRLVKDRHSKHFAGDGAFVDKPRTEPY